MTNKLSRRSLLRGASAIPLGAALSPAIIGKARAAAVKLRISSSQQNDPKFANGRVYFDNLSKHVKAGALGEQLELNYFPDNQLGQEIDVINSVKLGVIDMMISGSSISANLVPLVGAFDRSSLSRSRPRPLRLAPRSRLRKRCSKAPISALSRGPTISAHAACLRGKP